MTGGQARGFRPIGGRPSRPPWSWVGGGFPSRTPGQTGGACISEPQGCRGRLNYSAGCAPAQPLTRRSRSHKESHAKPRRDEETFLNFASSRCGLVAAATVSLGTSPRRAEKLRLQNLNWTTCPTRPKAMAAWKAAPQWAVHWPRPRLFRSHVPVVYDAGTQAGSWVQEPDPAPFST